MSGHEMNRFAFAGCHELSYQKSDGSWERTVDLSAYMWYSAIIFLWYGATLLITPFKLLPIEGNLKYLWLRFEAGFKEPDQEYTPFVKGMMHIVGVNFIGLGLIHVWASSDHPGFDFYTVLTVVWALQFAVFAYLLINGGFKKIKCAGWGVAFAACLALSIVVLAEQKNDDRQLFSNSSHPNGINSGNVLFFFAAFTAVGGLWAYLSSFDYFEAIGPNFYLEESIELDDFSRAVLRLNGVSTWMLSIYLWWAAVNYNATQGTSLEIESSDYGADFQFLFADWIAGAIFIAFWGIVSMVANPNVWEEFAIFQYAALVGSQLAVSVFIWKTHCYV